MWLRHVLAEAEESHLDLLIDSTFAIILLYIMQSAHVWPYISVLRVYFKNFQT